MIDIVAKIGFIFCNLINHCSSDLTETDLKEILPILLYLEENNNFEASLLLANYHDPGGCIFNNKIDDSLDNYIKAWTHYAKAIKITKNGVSDREKHVFKHFSNELKAFELATGKKINF